MAIKTFILGLCLFASQLYALEFGDIPATTDVTTLWLAPSQISNTAYASSWNGVTSTAPSKNSVYDFLHLFADDSTGKVSLLNQGAGITNTNSSGVVQTALTASGVLDTISSTQGRILFRGASGWTSLPTSTDGNILTTHGASADPTWSPPPSSAPSSAHFVTTQAESSLSNEFSLGSLTSGILKQTVASSISTPSIAASADIIALFSTCSGTQYLGADGACHNAGSTVTPAALTKTDDTNVTLTLGGTPSTALLQATSIAAGWTGTLAVSRGGSGAGTLTGLVLGNGTSAFTTVTAPSGAVVGTTDTQTLTNKRINPRIQTVTSASTVTVDADNNDAVTITAQAAALTIDLTGTPVNFQKVIIRIKDNGTARAITWSASYSATSAITLPSTTVISKVTTVGLQWDSVKAIFVCLAKDQEP